ncbi:ComF family protein [Rhodopirellula sallentina]|uniref:ComF family protein n=1 Tax=Rhodopirellula sallentina TaxID=1263869 RepID=UPI00118177B1|nr:ComF family protein [Rhodopirellula sallentina]
MNHQSSTVARLAHRSRQSVLQAWESVAPLVFPPVCVLCGAATDMVETGAERGTGAGRAVPPRQYRTFCRVCEASLIQSAPMMQTACGKCGWPRAARTPRVPSADRIDRDLGLPTELEDSPDLEAAPDDAPCARCKNAKRAHRFQRITPLYRYHDVARDAVVAAKYPHNSVVARDLASRLAARCLSRWPELEEKPESPGKNPEQTENPAPTSAGSMVRSLAREAGRIVLSGNRLPPRGVPVVTSVPSPWLRQVRRGGSGTRILAEYTASFWGLPYAALLRACRSISKQALLDDEERRANVRGAFRVRARARKLIAGREIVLVDDVMTTGATADEIAGVLLEAGAGKVSLAVVAMALRDD